MQSIQKTIQQLHRALCDYIEATYHISAKPLIEQRKRLLNQPGVIYQTPYLESTPRYKTGETFSDMVGLHAATREAFLTLSQSKNNDEQIIYDPPYHHQSEAIKESLIGGRNLMIMTGTGSGKTEAFLLPILGNLARQAKEDPDTFINRAAVRALILYPMNALVNDQLGRLRAMFGDPRLVRLFKSWCGRPARFARYTSRTPYAGVRTSRKDSTKYKAFSEFYVDTERCADDPTTAGHEEARNLIMELKKSGKWPAKPNLATWFGNKGSRWSDPKSGAFVRCVTLPDDSELLTRHEVQIAPPDILVTNYSMLEFMLMRPVERKIFDATREFLASKQDENFLVVLDEAHLYRGAAGAEVGLLLRRFRDRIGIPPDRFQVICATASFNSFENAPQFASQLAGVPASSFIPISGSLNLQPNCTTGSTHDAQVLANVNLQQFYESTTQIGQLTTIEPLLNHLGVGGKNSPEVALFHALKSFNPMGLLINTTMKRAVSISDLGQLLFPESPSDTADLAVTTLMALGSIARPDPKTLGLLPCRIHNFFRGLAGLWACLDPDCREITNDEEKGVCGRLYSQPRNICGCGARVLELYTCRNCGTAYARAYTDDLDSPNGLWSEPGQSIMTADGQTNLPSPLDLLLETPQSEDVAEPMDYDLETGRLNPPSLGPRNRRVYVCSYRLADSVEDTYAGNSELETRGQFKPCAVCLKTASFGGSYVQDHQTKGDEPFQALVAQQLQIQPPNRVQPTSFAPLQGRKVLTFSDSRQVAARLAPNLQMYSARDSLRPLIVWGFRKLESVDSVRLNLSLEDLYLAILLASKQLNVRLRPELKDHESLDAANIVNDAFENDACISDTAIHSLYMDLRSERPPESLLQGMVTTIQDRFYGFEALALASIAEKSKHTNELENLPSLSDSIDTSDTKVALVRTWLRCWQNYGFWLNSMPPEWFRRPRTEGMSVRGHKGRFKAMHTVLDDKCTRRVFETEWLPRLLAIFTRSFDGGYNRLHGSELTLAFDGNWCHCSTCKSVHRPVPGIPRCLDCGKSNVKNLNPDSNLVFQVRKDFYRNPVKKALAKPPRKPLALVAAEHTAQLNAPQNEDVFSKAEENELLFQDIKIEKSNEQTTAIDVLSSTTTMEVGIDIGTLSGVALRNMPPGRANYQQRSGRAGRRGNAVATVLAFGSADSHDEHYFRKPDEMIRGDVVDPRLTLDNPDIARRHVRAFLLQSYHQEKLPNVDLSQPHDLFSVLGSVGEFRSKESIINREDFCTWLTKNCVVLRQRVREWIPDELSPLDRQTLLDEMVVDCLAAVDDAIRPTTEEQLNGIKEEEIVEVNAETDEERPRHGSNTGKLLDRLLYCGKLPRYAFPIDVATFHVFDRDRSSSFRPVMRFAPQQGLPIALTQYAPSKQVWISGKCYVSGAIFSVYPKERIAAWTDKRIYMECSECGFAKTFPSTEVSRDDQRDCEACTGKGTFGPGRYWVRPPGFAHPIDVLEVTSPDDVPETSYATRAKLTIGASDIEADWIAINNRIRVLRSREYLLVTNSGPKKDGYTYCVSCGRIEASNIPIPTLHSVHAKPFPSDDVSQRCANSYLTRNIVLGTDFITDIALFSLQVAHPINLNPRHTSTLVALRTASEALAIAACRMLEIEPGEIMAEFRPALTDQGKSGLEAEIFLYDTLPGGAGFSSQLSSQGLTLFQFALEIMEECPEECDASCYRCLRSFKNKFEHQFLDRHVGKMLLKYLITGLDSEFETQRIKSSTNLLYQDLIRQSPDGVKFKTEVTLNTSEWKGKAPILAVFESRRQESIIALSGPLTPNYPSESTLRKLLSPTNLSTPLIVVDELKVRCSLPAASREVLTKLEL